MPDSTELNFPRNYEFLSEYGLAAPEAIIKVDSNSKAQIILIDNPHTTSAMVKHNIEVGTAVPCTITNLPKGEINKFSDNENVISSLYERRTKILQCQVYSDSANAELEQRLVCSVHLLDGKIQTPTAPSTDVDRQEKLSSLNQLLKEITPSASLEPNETDDTKLDHEIEQTPTASANDTVIPEPHLLVDRIIRSYYLDGFIAQLQIYSMYVLVSY